MHITIGQYRSQSRDRVFRAVVEKVDAFGMEHHVSSAIGVYVADKLLVNAIRDSKLNNLSVLWELNSDTGAAINIHGRMNDVRVVPYQPREQLLPVMDMPESKLPEGVQILDVSKILKELNLL